MNRAALAVLLLAVMPLPAAGQDSTAITLARIRALYDQLEVERALPLLRQMTSPGWRHPVSAAQRIESLTYLGALLVLVERRDSAVQVFRSLLEQEPFADLDQREFTPAQLGAFDAARRLVLSVGARPIPAMELDPRVGAPVFTIVTTHEAETRIEVRAVNAQLPPWTVFAGESQGLRQIRWNGLLGGGQLAPSGRYVLHVMGSSPTLRRSDSAAVYFDVRQQHPPLEDTLPPLAPHDLLPERFSGGAAASDVFKGAAVGVTALFLAGVVARGELRDGDNAASVVAGLALVVGGASYLRGRGRELPANVAANARRRGDRDAANAAIRQRNDARRAQTVLLLNPAAGVSN